MLYIVCLYHCMYVCYMFIKDRSIKQSNNQSSNQSINQIRGPLQRLQNMAKARPLPAIKLH